MGIQGFLGSLGHVCAIKEGWWGYGQIGGSADGGQEAVGLDFEGFEEVRTEGVAQVDEGVVEGGGCVRFSSCQPVLECE